MTSEIRTNTITSRAGLSTVTLTDSGPMFSGITTFVDNSTFSVGTGGTIHAPATNTLNIGVNNTESLRIDSNSNLKVAGIVTATSFVGGLPITSGADNRVITASSASAIQGESTLTYDGNDLQNLQSSAAANLTLKTTGNSFNSLRLDSNRTGANDNLSLIDGRWNGTVVSRIQFITGSDTSNKDDGYMAFHTRESGQSLTERLRITSDGKFGFGNSGSFSETTMAEFTSSVGGGAIGANITIRNSSTNSVNNVAELRLKTAHGVARFHKYNTGETYLSSHSGGASDLILEANGASNFRVNTNSAERLRIDSSGRLLLNQTSAYSTNQMMIINGASPAGNVYNGQLMIQGSETNGSSDTGARINFAGHDGNTQRSWANITGAKENGTGGNQASYLSFHTRPDGGSPSERLRITSTGDVLIHGTSLNNSSVSGQALQINGTTRPTLILRGNASGGNTCEIQFADNSGTDSDPGTRDGLIKYEHAGTYASHMHFHTNGTERVVISHSGRFGIANSPAELAGFAENLQVTGLYSSQYAAAFKIKQSSGSLMRFATTVSGSFNLCGGITVNGSSTSFNTSSDYRLKENDVKISDGITRLKQLRPIRFNWKSDSSTTEDGFFAHEVSPVVPESVTGEKDATIDEIGEGYQKIDHSKLVPLLTAALQEAITKIETLEQDNIALRARVTNLEDN